MPATATGGTRTATSRRRARASVTKLDTAPVSERLTVSDEAAHRREWVAVQGAAALVEKDRRTVYRWIALRYVRTTKTRRHQYVNVGDLMATEAALHAGDTPVQRATGTDRKNMSH